MKNSVIRWVIVLAVISILGIITVQVYWFNKAFDTEEEIFNREVNTALYNVATQFFKLNNSEIPGSNPIKQLSTNYYVVMINNEIDANLLEYLLKMEFEKRDIEADFEYGIYDCTNDKMVYGNYVSLTETSQRSTPTNLPKWENQNYYFGVQFPQKAGIITDRLGIWIFSSSVLILVIIFFSYTLFIILKQKRLSEIQKDFINNMTHEFKTPISTIAVSADVLSQPEITDQPDRLLQYASIIKKENIRLKNQVERVLQMAGMNKDKMSLKLENIRAHELIQEIIDPIESSYPDVTINLALQADRDTLCVDRLHFSNAINNLIDNAIKYSNHPVSIDIATHNSESHLVIAIRDNGIGIQKNELKRIFDKFYRVPTGNVHNVKGFGLGLSYVKQVIKAHEGRIEVDSSPGEGATFKLKLKHG